MTRVLQINLGRGQAASALMEQFTYERKADILIISEQYRNKAETEWRSDLTGYAAIWVVSRRTPIEASGNGPGYTWIKTRGITFFSCNLSPNDSIMEFERKLAGIEDEVRSVGGRVTVAGDFNSRAIEWGMPITDGRGRRILEMAARLGLLFANEGRIPTFRRAGCEGTIPDITMVSEALSSEVRNWHVLEDYSASDHQYIEYDIGGNTQRHGENPIPRWNIERLDRELFDTMLHMGKGALQGIRRRAAGNPVALLLVTATMVSWASPGS